ncbi:sialidase family protein [Hamadaea tsunoensis]|uniref:sialidase family protein n=1 Tax=Hamadaea tsunoensis TaxID=53368 RepID=UPI00040913C7|nr:sialidase family protein [Hamadaea tsunoensis]
MRISRYAVAVTPAILVLWFTQTPAAANVSLIQISSDTFTNTTSQHATQVEPDTYAFGSTIVMAAQTGRFTDGGASDVAFSTSTDNGATWSSGNLPGITKFSGGGPYDRVSDAAVAYDAAHNVWMISTLPLGESGGVHGAAIATSRSTDGGHTWGNPVITATGADLDKNWIACDNTASSPFYGHCYTEWDDHGNGNRIKMSTSTDGGLTWDAALNTSGSATGIGGQPVVQPNGTVVVPMASATETSIRAFRSTNGGASWGAPVTIASVGAHTVPGGLRSGPLPSAEVDGAGKVYVVWQDSRFRSGSARDDIVMSTSTDGATWTTVVRVPIDATTSTVDHFIPGIAVDRATSGSSAHIGLTYYFYPNSSCTASTCQLDVGFISSTNGGSTWSAATQLAGPFTLAWLASTTQGRMVGDYISTSFDANGLAHGCFATATANSGTTFHEAISTPSAGLAAAAGTAATQAYFLPQPVDSVLGDVADQVAIALGVEPIG